MAYEAGQKNPPPPSKNVGDRYLLRQGNKWGHQLGCEFHSSRY